MIEEKESSYEKIKLDKSYLNYYKIIEKKLPYKFTYLDEWLLKKSKLLLNETQEKQIKLKTYKRGTIIKADFGVGIGSEMSKVHFAIVLNNYDNPKNNVLTVVPLTSKVGKFNLNLGTLINDCIFETINKKLNRIKDVINSKKSLVPKEQLECNKINTLIDYYKNNIKLTYACCSLITTISKERIFLPINEYDIIGKTRCSDKIMDLIDKEIKDRFTKQICPST